MNGADQSRKFRKKLKFKKLFNIALFSYVKTIT